MHRFYWPEPTLAPGAEVELAALAHQLTQVLRLGAGADITLFNGDGCNYPARLLEAGKRSARALIVDRQPVATEAPVRVTLVQSSLKADKFDWVLQKATELGVAALRPVVSERSVVRPVAALAGTAARWQTILREAAEQSGRTTLPQLLPPAQLLHALNEPASARFFLWESRSRPLPSLGEATAAACRDGVQAFALLVGPEGGFAESEAAAAVAAGWQPVTLGPRILRAETAAMAALAVVMERCGGLQ
jgi:16S rRNA (uracil1498-N3)-methyltransferase